MTKRVNLEFSKDTHKRNNMNIDVFKFPAKSINFIKEKVVLTEEQQSEALDKILNANPNYLELPPEEQNGLIVTTLTLESVVQWLLQNNKINKNVTMYQAYMEGADIAVIEIFYVDNEKNAKIINQAFAEKSQGEKVVPFPKSKVVPADSKNKPADIIQLRKE